MCTHPLYISRVSQTYKDARCQGVLPSSMEHIRAFKLLQIGHPSALYGMQYNVVPCGKCIECLKRRQNDLSLRCEREASIRGSMHFVTLTYKDQYLPFAMSVLCLDVESGEVVNSTPYKIVTRSVGAEDDLSPEYRLQLVQEFRSRVKSFEPVYIYHKAPFIDVDDESLEYYYSFTPTLNRRDLRLVLKKFRVYYKRDFGVSLPDFSYVCAGEFGPRTCRPHYHICFFGLSDSQVQYFCNLWKFGMTNYKKVNAVNSDGTNGFQLASKYIGKYISKGKFECSSVKCKDVEKGRLCMSKGLGGTMSESLISYYRAYDVFGRYNPDTLVLESSGRQKLTSEQIDKLFEVIESRNSLELNGFRSPLPLYMVRKIWYIYDNFKKAYRSFTLRAMHSIRLRDRYLSDSQGEFERYLSQFASEDIPEAVASFCTYLETIRQNKEYNSSQDLFRFYSKSLF